MKICWKVSDYSLNPSGKVNEYTFLLFDVASNKNINSLLVICDAPLFIRAHSKAVLSKAIHNDTEFLSTNMVMDYSLLVGIDEAKMKLVVGIIGISYFLMYLETSLILM